MANMVGDRHRLNHCL